MAPIIPRLSRIFAFLQHLYQIDENNSRSTGRKPFCAIGIITLGDAIRKNSISRDGAGLHPAQRARTDPGSRMEASPIPTDQLPLWYYLL